MVVEFSGLPGAGKSTICKAITIPHLGKGDVPLSALRPGIRMLRAAFQVFLLALGARPLSIDRLRRAFNLVVFLRHYPSQDRTMILDQGMIQKTWSLLANATSYSEARRLRAMAALSAFVPDILVWVETPLDDAVTRLMARRHGNSRYDGLAAGEARHRLEQRVKLLAQIAREFARTPGVAFIELDGGLPPQENARKVMAVIASRPC